MFRTLPVFFVAGAAIEWFMIHVQVGKETFCEYRAVGSVAYHRARCILIGEH